MTSTDLEAIAAKVQHLSPSDQARLAASLLDSAKVATSRGEALALLRVARNIMARTVDELTLLVGL